MAKTVLLFHERILSPSKTFMLNQALAYRRYAPFFIGVRREGNALPVESLTLEDQGRSLRRRDRLHPRADPFLGCLGDRQVDVVHAHFGPDGLLAAPLAAALDVPLFVTFHGYDATRRLSAGSEIKAALAHGRIRKAWQASQYRTRLVALAKQGAHFLAVSDFIREALLRAGLPPKAVQTHHIGIPLPDRPPTRSPTFPQEILCIGRFVEKKGHRILLEAFAGLGEGYPAHLKLIGDGPLRPAIKAQIDALGLHAKVTLTGWLEPDAVQRELARASALVLPSVIASDGDTEGLPTALLEAGALALPVISTNTGGVSELISSNALGFVLPPRQVAPLTHSMRSCLEAPVDAREKALRLQTKIRTEFDCAKQTGALEALYDQAIAAHRRRG